MPSARPAPTVHKFGGAALADADAVRHAAAIVAAQRGDPAAPRPTVVVVSAMHGVTDALLGAAHAAAHGDAAGARRGLAALRARHDGAAREVAGDASEGTPAAQLAGVVEATFAELAGLLDGLGALGDLPASVADAVLARGERLSARLVVAALADAGVPAQYVDECDVIHTDGRAATPSPTCRAPPPPRAACSARCWRAARWRWSPGSWARRPPAPAPPAGPPPRRPGAWPPSRRSGAAAPTSPRRRWPACWARATSSSGRTCPGCSPPIRAWCPTRA
jgi:hypothetical protein